jgi:hypothetical protein
VQIAITPDQARDRDGMDGRNMGRSGTIGKKVIPSATKPGKS